MDFLEPYKFKKSEFEELDMTDEKIVWGKLKVLSDLAAYIDALRESLTRHLVVNGCQDCETEDDLKERWKGVEGLDNSPQRTPSPRRASP